MNNYEEGGLMKCDLCGGKGYVFKKNSKYSEIEKCKCSMHCEICNDTGYTEIYKDGYRFLKPCECRKLADKIKRYNELKIPVKYSQKTLDNFEIIKYDKEVYNSQKGIVDKLRNYIENFDLDSKGIILYGSNGIGKTHLLTALLSELVLRYKVTGLYLDFPQWILGNKYLFYENNENLQRELEKITGVDILVIDEFAKNRTDFEKEIFEKIFYERYNMKKIIFIGTNYDITGKGKHGRDIKEVVSPALFSRLGDFQSFEANLLVGEDYRLS